MFNSRNVPANVKYEVLYQPVKKQDLPPRLYISHQCQTNGKSIICREIVKNAHHNIPEPKETSSAGCFVQNPKTMI